MDYDKKLIELNKNEQGELKRLKDDYNKKQRAIKLKYEKKKSEIKRYRIMKTFEEFCYKPEV